MSKAWERNHAEWWNLNCRMAGGETVRENGMDVAIDGRSDGAVSLHRVRLKPDSATRVLETYLDQAAEHGVAIWAYATEWSKPDNVIEIFRGAGFQHAQRFDTLALDLSRVSRKPTKRRFDTAVIEDYSPIRDGTFVHPAVGPMTTAPRRRLIEKFERLDEKRPRRVWHFQTRTKTDLVGACALFVHAGVAGIYDLATHEDFRGQGVGRETLTYTLDFAKQLGLHVAALISTNDGLPLYSKIGFRPVGYTSFLYFSKTKARLRAAGPNAKPTRTPRRD